MQLSVAVMFCDMQSHLTSIPLNSKVQGQRDLDTYALSHLVRIFWSTFFLKLGLVALLVIILTLLPYVYKNSVSSYSKQISLISLNAQGSDHDLMVLLLDAYISKTVCDPCLIFGMHRPFSIAFSYMQPCPWISPQGGVRGHYIG